MIVKITDKNYASDEHCGNCDIWIHTDGEYKAHTCPDCGYAILPCNICPDHSKCQVSMDRCPVKRGVLKAFKGWS